MALPTHSDAVSAWRALSAALRPRVGDSSFEIWLAPLTPRSWDGETLTLTAPGATGDWLYGRYGAVIERCATNALGPSAKVTIAGGTRDGEAQDTVRTGTAARTDARRPVGADRDHPAGLHPRYRFEQFIIGRGNHLAHAAALAVAENPGQAYNPLFLYAPPGMGKTHLLHAIGNYIRGFSPGAAVRYETAESFTNHFITALNSRALEAFKQAYRNADVLLVDDVQFLASKVKTEEEFFHTFNALYENGRQLVLTCDRLPRALSSIEQRLRERFEAGLVAEIQPPDQATRVAILRKRAALDGIVLTDPGVLDLIADRVTDNIRALEGALIRVVAFHSLTRKPIDGALTAEVLDTMYPVGPRQRRGGAPTISDIQAAVAVDFDLTVEQLKSSSRTARLNWARQIAIHLARDLTGASLPAIGREFGGRNHATVLHACKRVSERLKIDQQAVEDVQRLREIISHRRGDRSC